MAQKHTHTPFYEAAILFSHLHTFMFWIIFFCDVFLLCILSSFLASNINITHTHVPDRNDLIEIHVNVVHIRHYVNRDLRLFNDICLLCVPLRSENTLIRKRLFTVCV